MRSLDSLKREEERLRARHTELCGQNKWVEAQTVQRKLKDNLDQQHAMRNKTESTAQAVVDRLLEGPLDMSREMNIAREDAMRQAVHRANRERRPMYVFVGPPDSEASTLPTGHNVWFVRSAEEGQPPGSELFHTQAPQGI